MPFFQIGKPRALSDIAVSFNPSRKTRAAIPIALIDDGEFGYLEHLRENGYALTQYHDISDTRMVAEYPIVVCDIKGVGTNLSAKYQGAHVIAELRKTYPDKFLVVYSSFTFDTSYNRFFAMADTSLNKDAPLDEWVEKLDRAARTMADPAKRWERVRNDLLLNGQLSLFQLLNLEQAFIKAMRNKSAAAFSSKLGDLRLDDAQKETLGVFAKSAIEIGVALALKGLGS